MELHDAVKISLYLLWKNPYPTWKYIGIERWNPEPLKGRFLEEAQEYEQNSHDNIACVPAKVGRLINLDYKARAVEL